LKIVVKDSLEVPDGRTSEQADTAGE